MRGLLLLSSLSLRVESSRSPLMALLTSPPMVFSNFGYLNFSPVEATPKKICVQFVQQNVVYFLYTDVVQNEEDAH